jgi:hypothetical protein
MEQAEMKEEDIVTHQSKRAIAEANSRSKRLIDRNPY